MSWSCADHSRLTVSLGASGDAIISILCSKWNRVGLPGGREDAADARAGLGLSGRPAGVGESPEGGLALHTSILILGGSAKARSSSEKALSASPSIPARGHHPIDRRHQDGASGAPRPGDTALAPPLELEGTWSGPWMLRPPLPPSPAACVMCAVRR